MGSVLSSLARRASASPTVGGPGRIGRARTPDNLTFALPARAVDDEESTGDIPAEPSIAPPTLTPSPGPAAPTHDTAPGPSSRPAATPALRIWAPHAATGAPQRVAAPEPARGSTPTPPTVREVAVAAEDGLPAVTRAAATVPQVVPPPASQSEAAPDRVSENRADASAAATTATTRSAATIAHPTPRPPQPPTVVSSPRLAVLPSPPAAAPATPRTIDVRIGRVEITPEREAPTPTRSAPVRTSETARDPFARDSAARSWSDRSGSWG
ncbi:hypothetical protein ABIA65_002983 [Mycolicibacterium sp. 624]